MNTKSLLGRKKKAVNTTNNLYKLKFYCDICKKQLRDANGLKQHNTTPLHKKNELVTKVDSTNTNKDQQLMFEFLRYLKTNGGLSNYQEVNKVYNSFILREKNHTHMISTNIHNLSVLMKRIMSMDENMKNRIFGGKYDVELKKPDNDMIEEGEYSRYLIKLVMIDDDEPAVVVDDLKDDKLMKERSMIEKSQKVVNQGGKSGVKFKKKLSIASLKKK